MDKAGCPRCDSGDVAKAAESPVKGVFDVYRCKNCNFLWRSTEDLSQVQKLPPGDMAEAIDLIYI